MYGGTFTASHLIQGKGYVWGDLYCIFSEVGQQVCRGGGGSLTTAAHLRHLQRWSCEDFATNLTIA